MRLSVLLILTAMAGLFSTETVFGQVPLRRATGGALLSPLPEDCAIKLETEDTGNPNLVKLKWDVLCASVKEAYLYGPFYLSSAEEPEKQDLLFNEDGTAGEKEPDLGAVCDDAKCRDLDLDEFPGAIRVMKIDLPKIAAEPSGNAHTKVYLPKNEFVLVVRSAQDVWKSAKVSVERPASVAVENVPSLNPADKSVLKYKSPEVTSNQAAVAQVSKGILDKFKPLPKLTLIEGTHHCDPIPGDYLPFADCKGSLDFQVEVVGISDSVCLYSNAGLVACQLPSGGVVNFANVLRDHGRTAWYAKSGSTISLTISRPYTAEFNLSDTGWSYSYTCQIDDCDNWAVAEGDCCVNYNDCGACPSSTVSDCTNHATYGSLVWSGSHIKSITSTCGGTFNVQPSGSVYLDQSGNWSVTKSGTNLNCDIKATTWDNGIIIRNFSVSWNDNC